MSFLKTMINSIARTFGRILAYALIGIAIYFIASKVHASPQYRMSNLLDEWGEWTNLTTGDTYTGSSNITTNWSAYIQLKDTTLMEANKSYNLTTSFQIKIIGNGDRELFSSIVPYVYNGSTLTSTSDKCTISGTKTDIVSSGIVPNTTHIYNANINCIGLKNTGYYPYFTIRLKANQNTLATSMQLNVSSWNFTIGSDSTDANNIMNNQNQNTQQIIENNNQNTQEITNAIKNQYNTCINRELNLLNYPSEQGYALNNDGSLYTSSSYSVSDYIPINENTPYTFTRNWTGGARYCFYDYNKDYISCSTMNSSASEININNTNGKYLRISFKHKSSTSILTGNYCFNALEKETEQNEEINNNLKQFLTVFSDDSTPSDSEINSTLNGINLPSDTPMTNLLMFPIVVFSFFSNSMSSSCSPIVLGTLYGHELSLPCLNVSNYLGLTLWNIIDLLSMFYMIYNIAHLLIGIFENISELRSPFLRFFIKNRGVIND